MYAYSVVLLAELHHHLVPATLTASRRAAERSAQLQAVLAEKDDLELAWLEAAELVG